MKRYVDAKPAAGRTVVLTLKDSRDFLLREITGVAPTGRQVDLEGQWEFQGANVLLNCQFKIETNLVVDDDDEPTAIRNRHRETLKLTVEGATAKLAWLGKTDVLKPE